LISSQAPTISGGDSCGKRRFFGCIPTPDSNPFGIEPGPDGALWFTEANSDKIGRITTAGVISEFPLPIAGSYPLSIQAGSSVAGKPFPPGFVSGPTLRKSE
jgi:streptogramin lyase